VLDGGVESPEVEAIAHQLEQLHRLQLLLLREDAAS
jgi:hypothetical protein